MQVSRFIAAAWPLAILCGCISLTPDEALELKDAENRGYTIGTPPSNFSPPVSVGKASILNLLPGIGNFYLAGKGGGGTQALAGVGNLLLWPISPVWSVYQGYSDANTLNERSLVVFLRENHDWELSPASTANAAVGISQSTASVPAESPVIEGWEYDFATYRGLIRLKMNGSKDVEPMRAMARDLIAKIVSDKNITIVAGESLPEGATFKMLGEKLEDGILQIEFEAN